MTSDVKTYVSLQEDAHLAALNVDNKCSVFGVFDGHGGREVAKYVSMYLVRLQPCVAHCEHQQSIWYKLPSCKTIAPGVHQQMAAVTSHPMKGTKDAHIIVVTL